MRHRHRANPDRLRASSDVFPGHALVPRLRRRPSVAAEAFAGEPTSARSLARGLMTAAGDDALLTVSPSPGPTAGPARPGAQSLPVHRGASRGSTPADPCRTIPSSLRTSLAPAVAHEGGTPGGPTPPRLAPPSTSRLGRAPDVAILADLGERCLPVLCKVEGSGRARRQKVSPTDRRCAPSTID
jgi:hypothetical protein